MKKILCSLITVGALLGWDAYPLPPLKSLIQTAKGQASSRIKMYEDMLKRAHNLLKTCRRTETIALATHRNALRILSIFTWIAELCNCDETEIMGFSIPYDTGESISYEKKIVTTQTGKTIEIKTHTCGNEMFYVVERPDERYMAISAIEKLKKLLDSDRFSTKTDLNDFKANTLIHDFAVKALCRDNFAKLFMMLITNPENTTNMIYEETTNHISETPLINHILHTIDAIEIFLAQGIGINKKNKNNLQSQSKSELFRKLKSLDRDELNRLKEQAETIILSLIAEDFFERWKVTYNYMLYHFLEKGYQPSECDLSLFTPNKKSPPQKVQLDDPDEFIKYFENVHCSSIIQKALDEKNTEEEDDDGNSHNTSEQSIQSKNSKSKKPKGKLKRSKDRKQDNPSPSQAKGRGNSRQKKAAGSRSKAESPRMLNHEHAHEAEAIHGPWHHVSVPAHRIILHGRHKKWLDLAHNHENLEAHAAVRREYGDDFTIDDISIKRHGFCPYVDGYILKFGKRGTYKNNDTGLEYTTHVMRGEVIDERGISHQATFKCCTPLTGSGPNNLVIHRECSVSESNVLEGWHESRWQQEVENVVTFHSTQEKDNDETVTVNESSSFDQIETTDRLITIKDPVLKQTYILYRL